VGSRLRHVPEQHWSHHQKAESCDSFAGILMMMFLPYAIGTAGFVVYRHTERSSGIAAVTLIANAFAY
jgi:hypothetical protein